MKFKTAFRSAKLALTQYSISYKKKLFLIISITVSMVIFLAVSLYLDFAFATNTKESDEFQDNYINIYLEEFDHYNNVKQAVAGTSYFCNIHGSSSSNVYSKNGDEGIVLFNIIYTTDIPEDIYFRKANSGLEKLTLEKYKILCGRGTHLENNEIVISKEHAILLNNNIDLVIGEKIPISRGESTEIFKIVGVYEQTLSESKANKSYISEFESEVYIADYHREFSESGFSFDVFISADSIALSSDNDYQNISYDFYCFYKNQNEKEKINTAISKIQNNVNESNIYTIDKDIIMFEKNQYRSNVVYSKLVVMIIVMLISGINIFGAMQNSVNERKREIGIKKALGASDGEIMFGFVIENILNIFLSCAFALSITLLGFLIYSFYQRQILFVDYTIFFYKDTIIMFLIFFISCTFGFSLIPAYTASQTNIIETIRVD